MGAILNQTSTVIYVGRGEIQFAIRDLGHFRSRNLDIAHFYGILIHLKKHYRLGI